MGYASHEGEPPFLAVPAQVPTARASGHGVEFTVTVSVEGSGGGRGRPDFEIKVPMSSEDARSLADQLMAAANAAEGGQSGR